MEEENLTKKQKRRLQRQERRRNKERGGQEDHKSKRPSLSLQPISPLTPNQKRVFEAYWNEQNLLLHGTAGTGKTFVGCYLALQEVLDSDVYEKVVIVRSAEPTKNQGFLPGSLKEKIRVYESPYYDICAQLFGRGDAYDILKGHGKIEFTTTSYMRGITYRNCIVLVDEVQNLTSQEANTIITRVGENCKIIFAGDIRQNDLQKGRERSGLKDFMEIIRRMRGFTCVEFQPEDICRSELIKEYILIRNALEDKELIQPL